MNPQNDSINQENQQNATPINLGNRKMIGVWLALIGGFVIIILLVALLFYKPSTEETNIIQENIQQEQITPADENIDQEVENVNLGDLESDFQEIEEDIDQL